MNKLIFTLLLFTYSLAGSTHPGLVDSEGGHIHEDTEDYHCHLEPCFALKGEAQDLNQILNEDTTHAHIHAHNIELYIVMSLFLVVTLLLTFFLYRVFLRKKKPFVA